MSAKNCIYKRNGIYEIENFLSCSIAVFEVNLKPDWTDNLQHYYDIVR